MMIKLNKHLTFIQTFVSTNCVYTSQSRLRIRKKKDNKNLKGNWESYPSSCKCVVFLLYSIGVCDCLYVCFVFYDYCGMDPSNFVRVIKVSRRVQRRRYDAHSQTKFLQFKNALEITDENSCLSLFIICLQKRSRDSEKYLDSSVAVAKVESRSAVTFLFVVIRFKFFARNCEFFVQWIDLCMENSCQGH